MALVILAGLLARALLIASTRGTSDLALWESFIWSLDQHGLAAAYAHSDKLNHPPLGALLVWGLHALGPLSLTLRISQALSDVATLFFVARIAERLGAKAHFAGTLFFLSPVAILTSSFYCNTDSTLVALMTATVLLLLDRRDAAAGAAFACACAVKILPVLALPLLVLKGRRRFFVAYVVVSGVIYLPVFVSDPLHFAANVFGYAGSGQTWGLALPATLLGAAGTWLQWPRFRAAFYAFSELYSRIARLCVLAVVALVTWTWWRNRRDDTLPAAVTLIFLGAVAVAPRVAPGYFLWFLPLLAFTLPRALALVIHIVASLQLAFIYSLYSGGFPFTYADFANTTAIGRAIDLSGVPLWILCLIAFAIGVRRIRSAATA